MNFRLKLSALRQARFKGLNKWRKSRIFWGRRWSERSML